MIVMLFQVDTLFFFSGVSSVPQSHLEQMALIVSQISNVDETSKASKASKGPVKDTFGAAAEKAVEVLVTGPGVDVEGVRWVEMIGDCGRAMWHVLCMVESVVKWSDQPACRWHKLGIMCSRARPWRMTSGE